MTLVSFCTMPARRQGNGGTIYPHGPPQLIAMLSLGDYFLACYSELVAIRIDYLKFTPDGALKGMIKKSTTDQYGKGQTVFDSRGL